MADWKNKTAVITGAGGVLLGAFAKHLASKGVKIAVLSRNPEHAQHTVEDIVKAGGTAKAYACDVLDKTSLVKAEEAIFKDFGTYHILINGAGGNMEKANTSAEYYDAKDTGRSFFDLDSMEIQKVFNLNVLGAFLTTQVFAKRMVNVPGATVINVSSMAADRPMTKVLGYAAAKAALDNLTKWLAVHFSKTTLRVNAVAPGFFVTEQNRTLLKNADGTLTARSGKIIAATPMGRFGEVEDLFGAFMFLCDDEASKFVTGVTLAVDGGFSSYSGV